MLRIYHIFIISIIFNSNIFAQTENDTTVQKLNLVKSVYLEYEKIYLKKYNSTNEIPNQKEEIINTPVYLEPQVFRNPENTFSTLYSGIKKMKILNINSGGNQIYFGLTMPIKNFKDTKWELNLFINEVIEKKNGNIVEPLSTILLNNKGHGIDYFVYNSTDSNVVLHVPLLMNAYKDNIRNISGFGILSLAEEVKIKRIENLKKNLIFNFNNTRYKIIKYDLTNIAIESVGTFAQNHITFLNREGKEIKNINYLSILKNSLIFHLIDKKRNLSEIELSNISKENSLKNLLNSTLGLEEAVTNYFSNSNIHNIVITSPIKMKSFKFDFEIKNQKNK